MAENWGQGTTDLAQFVKSGVQRWVDEHMDFTYGATLTADKKSDVGHYTQVGI